MNDELRERLKATWREIVTARKDSDILNTNSGSGPLSVSGKSSDQRWGERLTRVHRILSDRQQQYGDATALHAQLGRIWGARLGVEISSRMVLLMLMDMKTARAENREPSQDTLDDVVGYATLYGDAG